MSEDQIKENLLKEKENLEKQLINYSGEDPYLGIDRDSTHNLEDAPTESEEHDRIKATTRDLQSRLKDVAGALERLGNGKYGKCESCKKPISQDRLLAMPTARFCLDCQSKAKNW